MKKILLTIMAVAGLLLSLGAASAPAQADDSDVKITLLGTDAIYSDNWRNRNQEFIQFTNKGDTSVDVLNWKTRDGYSHANQKSKCNTVTLTADNTDLKVVDGKLLLPPKHHVRVYTGYRPGGATTFTHNGEVYHAVYMNHGIGATKGCGYKGHYLTNGEDTVYVVDAQNKNVDQHHYNNRAGYRTVVS